MKKNKKTKDKYITNYVDVSGRVKVSYKDESTFQKYSRSLKQYNMHAYKDLIFNLLPKIRNHIFEGETEDNIHYSYYLESSSLFEQVHGKVYLVYTYIEPNEVILEYITPENFLLEGHSRMLETYRGVPITSSRDRFKVDFIYSTKGK